MTTPVTTRTMASIIGPFALVLGATLALRAQVMPLLISSYIQDTTLILFTGVVTLVIGLIMIAAHQSWNGAAAIVISLFGWLTALRGALLLLAPDILTTIWDQVLAGAQTFLIAGAALALIGAWLTYVGWFAKT